MRLRDWWRRLWGRKTRGAATPPTPMVEPPTPQEANPTAEALGQVDPAVALALEWSTLHDERTPHGGLCVVGTLPAKRLPVIDASRWRLRLAAVQQGWDLAAPNERLLGDAMGAFISLLLVSDPQTVLCGMDEHKLVQELLRAHSAQDAMRALLRRFSLSAQEVILRWTAIVVSLMPGKN